MEFNLTKPRVLTFIGRVEILLKKSKNTMSN